MIYFLIWSYIIRILMLSMCRGNQILVLLISGNIILYLRYIGINPCKITTLHKLWHWIKIKLLNPYSNPKWKIKQHGCINQRLPGACNRSPGSKLLSIPTQLHCGSHLGGRARLSDTILEEDHQMTIPSKFGSNWATGSRQDGFYVNFP